MSYKLQKLTVAVLALMIVVALVILSGMLLTRDTVETGPPIEVPEIPLPDSTRIDDASYQIDITPYREAIEANEAKYLLLVNSMHNIGSTVPDNIVSSKRAEGYSFTRYNIEKTALDALTAMCLEAEANGIRGIDLTSAYRSYDKQAALFSGYCEEERKKDPTLTQTEVEKLVETYSCRPGTSEHQTGLAVDLWINGDYATLLEESFGETQAGQWLAENCHRFGFILRFPEDKTEITGIQYEPWHFRFVGYAAACEIKEKGMCLEEYIAYCNK